MSEFSERLLNSLEHAPEFPQAAAAFYESLRRRNIYFGDGLLPTYPIPFLVPQKQLARWIEQSDEIAQITEEIAQQALVDPKLYAALGLNPDARALTDIDPGYRHITTLSRPDAVVVGDELRFVEFNCDSPAMMSFADAVGECLLEMPMLAALRDRFQQHTMTDRLLTCLLDCYREFGGAAKPPTIAICDWDGQKTRYEHREIARSFEAAGVPTVVCDPRALKRPGRGLELDGRRIDIVYRRALFIEILERQSEVQPLLLAYRHGEVCMVNSLRSYAASSKTLMAYLSQSARGKSIAETAFVDAARAEKLRSGPRRHVLKRGESHGGQHVLLPHMATDAEWHKALDECGEAPWIMQECLTVPEMPVLTLRDGVVRRENKYFNWNPFLFGGRYAGGIARASDTPLINISLGGGLLPTFAFV